MRLILLLILFGMQLQAAFYLRQRSLSFFAYLGWGLLAVLLPPVGPFLVILSQPGERILPVRRSEVRQTAGGSLTF
jgi:hypothetical protein